MPVKLYLRNETPAPGMPMDICSVYETVEDATAQAVSDLRQANREYSPTRIEAEDGSILADRAALEKAAAGK